MKACCDSRTGRKSKTHDQADLRGFGQPRRSMSRLASMPTDLRGFPEPRRSLPRLGSSLAILLALAILLSLAGCGRTPAPTDASPATPLPERETSVPTAAEPTQVAPSPTPTDERPTPPAPGPTATAAPSPAPTATSSPESERTRTVLTPFSTPPQEASPTPTALQLREPADGEHALCTIPMHSMQIDDEGVVHVIGQVYNGSAENLKWVKIVGTFYDEQDELLAEKETYAYIDVLRPDEKAPFDLVMWEPPAGLESYALEVSATETEEEPFLGIQFVQHGASFDPEGQLRLLGEVTNTAEQPASQVRIAGAVYDAEGQILKVGFTYAERDILETEHTSPFEMYLGAVERGTPSNYTIIAYGQQAEEHEIESQARVEVLDTGYMWDAQNPADERRDLTIIGEVRNVDAAPARFVKVYASFYDAEGALVAVGWSYAWRDRLPPGERSPFQIDLWRAPASVERWTVEVQGQKAPAEAGEPLLTLEDTANTVSEDNVATFSGQVRNQGAAAAGEIEVGVTIYGPGEEVLAVSRVQLDGELSPGQSMPFELALQVTDRASSFNLYVSGSKTSAD
jgi:hypothetical protein